MKKGNNIILFFLILIIFVYLGSSTSHAQGFEQINSKILQTVSGDIVEFGLKYELRAYGEADVVVNELMDKLIAKSDGMNIGLVNDDYQYCIDFNSESTKGYIQYLKSQEDKIIINIIEKSGLDRMQELKDKINKAVLKTAKDTKCFQYIKASTGIEDMLRIKSFVETILKKSGALNVKTTELSQGYSIMALVGYEKPMKVGEDLVNINCAVYKYKSGNYVIIGTPVISTNY